MSAHLSGLALVLVFVLIGPFLVKGIEKQLEVFLLAMGVVAATISGVLDIGLLKDAVYQSVTITAAVLLFGLAFHFLRRPIRTRVEGLERRLGLRPFFFLVVVGLGLLTSVVTAIIASLVLVEVVDILNLDEQSEAKLVVVS